MVIFVCRELVFGVRLRTPAIVPGNTHHAVIQAYFHEIAGENVIDVRLFGFPVFRHERVMGFSLREVLPLVRAIGFFPVEIFNPVAGNVKLHEVRVGNKQEALPGFIRECQPAGFCLVAVFLWPYVWNVLLLGRTFVMADKRSVIPVTIVFLGTPSEIFQLIYVRGDSETYSDSGKFGGIRLCF